MTARDEVLARVRRALDDVPADEGTDDVPVPRDYRHTSSLTPADQVDRFAERVADYRATVDRCTAADVSTRIGEALRTAAVRRLVVPADLPAPWRPDGVDVVVDDGQLSTADLDAVDGVLTGCALAIAETGTIVLDAGSAQGRRAITLVPDYYLCVVRAEQVVGSVPEAISSLDGTRPTTFISGPSATSDIELDRVEGVHGPRTLVVVLVEAT